MPEQLTLIRRSPRRVVCAPLVMLLAAVPLTDLAQADTDATTLSVAQMQEDLEFLVDKLQQVHPATAEGVPAALQKAIERARGRIQTGPRSRGEFRLLLARVLVPLKDGHSAMAPLASGGRVDLPFWWLREGMIVHRNTDDLRRGDRIVLIGDTTEEQLFEMLRTFVPAENDHWIRAQGESLLREASVLKSFALSDGSSVRVEIERDGRRHLLAVPMRAEPAPGEPRPWARWKIHDDSALGVLTLDKCIFDAFYRRTVRSFFAAVHERGVEAVAIDVRNNQGGTSRVIAELLRYLERDFYWPYAGDMRISRDAISQRKYELEPGFYPAGSLRLPRSNGRPEELPRFGGKVYVLTSKRTFSTGNWFAVVFQDNGIAEVLGEPTGNAPSSPGDALSFTIPQSKLRFTLSHKFWRRPDSSKDPADSLIPDRVIRLTREHVANEVDPVLEHLRAGRVEAE